jgi:tetratricopeptide (TPR) repeat protein
MRLPPFPPAWLLLALAIGARPADAACTLGKIAELPVTMSGLVPLVPAKVNGVDALFIADSGAFFSMVTPAGVTRFGLQPGSLPFGFHLQGVGGSAYVSLASARDFTFAGRPYHHVDFLVGEQGFGHGAAGLLGQNVLGHADVEYDLANGVIRLMAAEGCRDDALSYWTRPNQVYSVIGIDATDPSHSKIAGSARLNGVKINVVFDTGAPLSILSLSAAARAGVRPRDPGVISAGYSGGVGQRSYVETWIAPFARFKLDDEEVQNTRLRIGDTRLGEDIDMLIGADFFLSHRVYVAKSQNKLYFTYNGGPVFRLDASPAAPDAAVADKAPDSAYADVPTDAAGFGRRAAAYAARHDLPHALADIDRAVALDPASAAYLRERGAIRIGAGQADAAMADFDQALKLKPGDVGALLERADLNLARGNLGLARLDLSAADRAAAGDPDARLRIGAVYMRANMAAASIAQYDQGIAAHPKDDRMAAALNGRCWVRAVWNQDLPLALADCNAALKLSPGHPLYLASRGLVRLRLGDYDQAISDYDGALRLTASSPWPLYGRGLARLRKGQAADGEADIRAAAARWPHFADEARARGLTP